MAGQNLKAIPRDQLINAYKFARIASPEYQQAARWRENARAAIMAQPEQIGSLEPKVLQWLKIRQS